ncbi:heterokaryon incompatibility protein-domain-containing protein [Hyaloscypha finlandica]|nr:heterokaryon incompatibility protein-domain-containing protein [Hyaloscypha finlandica]
MLSAWINDCQANHPSCQQIMHPKLPTRVIDVGSGTVQPCLKITHGEVGRYRALSHRWGTLDSQLKMSITKRECIENFCRAIPFETFPLTFRHAIEVSRSLGIQYLWINYLCIVQDDLQDWEAEAARMGDIYENACVALFAERANHCDDGLFQTIEDKSIATDWIRELEKSKFADQRPILAFCLVDKAISQLQSRGWIMQEEILSRRKICFSETELHWQCRSMSRCECGLKSLADPRFTNDLTKTLLSTQRNDGSVTRGLSTSNNSRFASNSNIILNGRTTDLNKSWKKLVETYAHRTFTHERDRLSALAGVASKLGRLCSSTIILLLK